MELPTEPSTVYLSSLDSTRLAPVRRCRLLGLLTFDTGKQAMRATLEPPVPGQDFDVGDDIADIIVTARHAGATLEPLSEFPCFVFVSIIRPGPEPDQSALRADDLIIIGWGELYRTREDAERHTFEQT